MLISAEMVQRYRRDEADWVPFGLGFFDISSRLWARPAGRGLAGWIWPCSRRHSRRGRL
jgi:hypothetical protein